MAVGVCATRGEVAGEGGVTGSGICSLGRLVAHKSQVIGKDKVFKSLHRVRFFQQKSAGKFDLLRKLNHGGGDGRAKIRLGKICAAI